MWKKFKVGIIVLLIIAALGGIGKFIYDQGYSKGVNVAAYQISRYELASVKLKNKLATAQASVDTRVITQYRDRVEYVDRVKTKTQTVVRESVPEQFKLSKGWVYAYNQSVAGAEPDAFKASDPDPSNTSDRSGLLAITANNGICLANQAQLDSLQQWVRETEASRKEIVGEKNSK